MIVFEPRTLGQKKIVFLEYIIKIEMHITNAFMICTNKCFCYFFIYLIGFYLILLCNWLLLTRLWKINLCGL